MDDWPPHEDGGGMGDWEPAVDGASECRGSGDDQELIAILEGSPEGERTCTLVPGDAGEAQLMTQWVSADTGSFVALEDTR